MKKYTFEDIAGYAEEKEELKRLCDVFQNREKFVAKGAKMPKGIIFYGQAGTGKTLFAKVLADVCGLEVMKIDLGDVENESVICRHIKKTFVKAARKKTPTMIFFDEVDKILPNAQEKYYTDRSKTILTQLLTLIDGMDSADNIVFVATCNYYGSLPETLTRPGRLDKKISIGEPNCSSRLAILQMYAKRSSCFFQMPLEEVAELCVGFSCAALETLVNECILRSGEDGAITKELVYACYREIKDEDIPKGRKVDFSDTIEACHNIGKYVVAQVYNQGDGALSKESYTTCNDFFDGLLSMYDDDYESDEDEDDEEDDDDDYDDYDDDDYDDYDDESSNRCYYSKSDMLHAITVLLGGYAVEEVVFNKTYDGKGNVFWLVDEVLFDMARQGMFGLSMRYDKSRAERMSYPYEKVEMLNCIFEETIVDCYEEARQIIEDNEELIRKLIPVVRDKEHLTVEESRAVVAENGGVVRRR